MEKATIEISKPRRFGFLGILAYYAVSFLLGVPFLIVVIVISVKHLGLYLDLFILLFTLLAVICILPLFGNLCIAWLARSARPKDPPRDKTFVVQITFYPRLRKGIRALIEDADDFGYLTIEDSVLAFHGDSVRMTIPYERIRAVHGDNIGPRGLYLSAGRVTIEISGLGGFEGFEIAERSSRTLPSSRKLTRDLYDLIRTSASSGLERALK